MCARESENPTKSIVFPHRWPRTLRLLQFELDSVNRNLCLNLISVEFYERCRVSEWLVLMALDLQVVFRVGILLWWKLVTPLVTNSNLRPNSIFPYSGVLFKILELELVSGAISYSRFGFRPVYLRNRGSSLFSVSICNFELWGSAS